MNTCRYCGNWRDQTLIRYSTRALAHPKCWLDRGRTLAELPWFEIEKMPFFLLKERGLLDEAKRLIDAKNRPLTARDRRLEKILSKGAAQ